MLEISLNGDQWQLRRSGEREAIPAVVPGCVHTDLMRAGRIPDPLFRDNEANLLWIGETDWTYQRVFTVPPELLEQPHVILHCAGLDTLAKLTLNGVEIGSADNMYRTWEYDVKSALRPGENRFVISFASPLNYLRGRDARERMLPAWVGSDKVHGGGWLRKEPCNFGWDWGPKVVTSGIWRDISLIGYAARLRDTHIRQQHDAGQVTLTVDITAETPASGHYAAQITVWDGDTQIVSTQSPFAAGAAQATLKIDQPKLWWINGMGDQPLYRVEVALIDSDANVIDTQHKRIGLRTLVLDRHADQWGESFQFVINGIPFFAKGANWIPADVFVARMTPERYERLIHDAADAHMNMLRVWGGGIYEQDAFYDLCDQYGIALWQDFMFACATYPGFDDAYCANVTVEAADNVRRLRHHPSIALWCGNNELEQGLVGDTWTDKTMSWTDYSRLFDQILPEVVHAADPERAYTPSSPHNPTGNRYQHSNPESGDAHLWDVWHGKKPFEWYRTCFHRFASEFGFQSFPEPSTMNAVTAPEDRNITSYVMEYRQRSGIGNTTIMQYLLDWFRLPVGYEESVWLTQILQGMAMKYAIEHWRRNMPRTMGTLYWQLNDCWEAPSWASIDYYGRWKALHYMAKRFFAPILISGVEQPEQGSVEIHVTSDQGEAQAAVVRWSVTTAAGEVVAHGDFEALIPARGSASVKTLDVSEAIRTYGMRDLLVWLSLDIAGETVSDNLVLFARPKHLKLSAPNFHTEIIALDDRRFSVQIDSNVPALWVWVSSKNGNYLPCSDIFFHVQPGHAQTLIVTVDQPMSVQEFRGQVVVQSLVDTYRELALV